jgi:hypothetical protein
VTCCSIVGVGNHIIALSKEATPSSNYVIKIPRNDNFLRKHWRPRLEFLGRRFTKRLRRQNMIGAAAGVGRDFISNRAAVERKSEFLLLLPLLKRLGVEPGIRNLLADFEIVESIHITSIDGQSVDYVGPAIVQERAQRLISLNDMSVDDLVAFRREGALLIHELLWRQGMGLAATRETWGPENWGVGSAKKMVLFDFSSFSSDKNRVRRAASFESSRGIQHNYEGRFSQDQVRKYFDYARNKIQELKLDQMWPQ